MRALAIVVTSAVLGLTVAAGSPTSADARVEAKDAGADSGALTCVRVRTEARYVPAGYNHVVILTSACTQTAECTVSTDVNPEPQHATVKASETVEVLTFMASPASVFTAKVSCAAR